MVGSRALFFKPEASLEGGVMIDTPILGYLGNSCVTAVGTLANRTKWVKRM